MAVAQDDFKQQYSNLQSEGSTTSAIKTPAERKARRTKRKARRQGAPAPYYETGAGISSGAGAYGGSSVNTGTNPYTAPARTTPQGNYGGTPGMNTSTGPSLSTVAPFNTVSGPGAQMMIANPAALFAQATGTQSTPGSYANQWYGDTYNPKALATALGGDLGSDAAIINFGKQLADQFTGQAGLGNFLDPRYILSSLFNLAGQVQPGRPGDPMDPLSAMAGQDPATAFRTFMGILEGAVGGIMPEDTFSALVQTINMYAQEYMLKWANEPPEEEAKRGGGVIQYIASRLGPSFGA